MLNSHGKNALDLDLAVALRVHTKSMLRVMLPSLTRYREVKPLDWLTLECQTA